ncbi:MAG: PHP domain-containing protein, partial [Clostridia bacterium]|nr:PHP domain-containing protein [Clostridia bacterium]
MGKFELHVHTAECDKVARVGGAEIVRMYADAGYDGLVITDHYFSLFFDWFSEELTNADHKAIIDHWLRGYHAARNEGEKLGFTVLPGAEVRFDGTINDYLVYGLEEDFFYHAPLLNRLSGLEELLQVLPPEVCVVQAHPFRNKMTVCDPAPLFGIEVHNGGTEPFRNHLARLFAEHYGKPMTAGSDFHNQ